MVELVFDAGALEPATFGVTFGRSKREIVWTDRRNLTMAQLAGLLCKTEIGPKDGACFTPAVFRSTARKMDQAETIGLAVLDSDCGHTLDEIATTIRAHGWEAIIHSTFSHMTDTCAIATSAIDKWRETHGDDIPGFMREKKGFLPHIVANARIIDEQKPNYIVEHAPCPKYRVILPLERPWQASEFQAQSEANGQWANRIMALAAALRLFADESCKDTSRLFFLPRRLNEATPFEAAHIDGSFCDIWSLPDARPLVEGDDLFTAAPARNRVAAVRETSTEDKSFRDDATGAHINLTHWAVEYAERFEVASALRSTMPSAFGTRHPGVKWHIECPFDDEHTQAGDRSGTYLVNASEMSYAGLPSVNSGFYVGCKHNACARRDRLDFIRGMLARNWLSVSDLTNPRFLIRRPQDECTQDFSNITVGGVGGAAEIAENLDIGAHLTSNLPGVMGSMMKYILQTSPKPQPVLALGAVLTGMAAAIGRKVRLAEWNTRPNIFIVGLAYSGAGKDRPMSAIKAIFKRAGLYDKLVGAEKIASDAGIVAELHMPGKESHVMLLDEIGHIFQAIGSRNASPHLAGVASTLMTIYTSSDKTFKGKSYADSTKNFTVEEPSVSLFGTTVPNALYRALRTDSIEDGLLSRIMPFQIAERDNDKRARPPGDHPMPMDVIDWVKAWYARPATGLEMQGGIPVLTPISVSMSADARRVSERFLDECEAQRISSRPEGLDNLWVRAHENACKIALIRATANGGPDVVPQVDETCMQWGVTLSRLATLRMVQIARDHVSDTLFQQQLAAFRHAIKRAGPLGLTVKELMRIKACQLPEREFDQVTGYLKNCGEVAHVNTNAGKFKANGVPIRARDALIWVAGTQVQEWDSDEAVPETKNAQTEHVIH